MSLKTNGANKPLDCDVQQIHKDYKHMQKPELLGNDLGFDFNDDAKKNHHRLINQGFVVASPLKYEHLIADVKLHSITQTFLRTHIKYMKNDRLFQQTSSQKAGNTKSSLQLFLKQNVSNHTTHTTARTERDRRVTEDHNIPSPNFKNELLIEGNKVKFRFKQISTSKLPSPTYKDTQQSNISKFNFSSSNVSVTQVSPRSYHQFEKKTLLHVKNKIFERLKVAHLRQQTLFSNQKKSNSFFY